MTNRLQALLKNYYPQALPMLHEHIWRPINLDFLRKWPTPQALRRATKTALDTFFHSHGSRSQKRREERFAIVGNLVPLTDDPDIIEPAAVEMKLIVDQIEVLNRAVHHYDREIEKLCSEHARYSFFRDLPDAGPALAPRLFAAFAQHAPHCENAARFAALCGMAPVTDQSGKSCRVYRRMRCDNFLRQTLHEWAKESWKHSSWARAFVRHHQKKNKSFHTIIRMLAVKWIRILIKCWHEGVPYNEEKYLQILRSRGCEYLTAAA